MNINSILQKNLTKFTQFAVGLCLQRCGIRQCDEYSQPNF